MGKYEGDEYEFNSRTSELQFENLPEMKKRPRQKKTDSNTQLVRQLTSKIVRSAEGSIEATRLNRPVNLGNKIENAFSLVLDATGMGVRK